MNTPLTGITIRPLARADVCSAVDLLQSCHRQPDGALSKRYRSDNVGGMLRASLVSRQCPHRTRVLVASSSGVLVGVVAYRSAFFATTGWEIAYWGTAPEQQGLGIGTQLLDSALSAIQELAKPDDFVQVRTKHAGKFTRRGFRSTAEDPSILMVRVGNLRLSASGDAPAMLEVA